MFWPWFQTALPNYKLHGFQELYAVKSFIRYLNHMNHFTTKTEIVIDINSSGGVIGYEDIITHEKHNMLEQIQEQFVELQKTGISITTVVGEGSLCYSLATDIFNLADNRIIHPSCKFMFHSVQPMSLKTPCDSNQIGSYNNLAEHILDNASHELFTFLKNKRVLEFEEGIEMRLYMSGAKLLEMFPNYGIKIKEE